MDLNLHTFYLSREDKKALDKIMGTRIYVYRWNKHRLNVITTLLNDKKFGEYINRRFKFTYYKQRAFGYANLTHNISEYYNIHTSIMKNEVTNELEALLDGIVSNKPIRQCRRVGHTPYKIKGNTHKIRLGLKQHRFGGSNKIC